MHPVNINLFWLDTTPEARCKSRRASGRKYHFKEVFKVMISCYQLSYMINNCTVHMMFAIVPLKCLPVRQYYSDKRSDKRMWKTEKCCNIVNTGKSWQLLSWYSRAKEVREVLMWIIWRCGCGGSWSSVWYSPALICQLTSGNSKDRIFNITSGYHLLDFHLLSSFSWHQVELRQDWILLLYCSSHLFDIHLLSSVSWHKSYIARTGLLILLPGFHLLDFHLLSSVSWHQVIARTQFLILLPVFISSIFICSHLSVDMRYILYILYWTGLLI
jgi:hypothetical protein